MSEAVDRSVRSGTWWLPGGRANRPRSRDWVMPSAADILVMLSRGQEQSSGFYFRTTLWAPFTFSFAP